MVFKNTLLLHALLSTFSPITQAAYLHVASYDGNLTTLSLTPNLGTTPVPSNHPHWYFPPQQQRPQQWTYNLNVVSNFNTSVEAPSWLTFNPQNNILYLIDEALTSANGTIVSYRTDPTTGSLTELHRTDALVGGVSGVFFANGAMLAVAHYTGSSLQTYTLDCLTGATTLAQTFTFSMSGPGPVPNRQEAPHPHQAITDPTGQYILVPDLGADLVRIFSIDPETHNLTPLTPLRAQPGSGPRHATFSTFPIAGSHVFYLAGEISATVTAYRVTYLPSLGGLTFIQLPNGIYPSLGPGHPIPPTTTGESTGVTAELAFSPDGAYLIASNRRDLSFNSSSSIGPYSSSTTPSDSLATWRFQPGAADGELQFLGLFPAGGEYPRQFALNRAGNLVAVGLQRSERVVVLERNTVTGGFVRQVAEIEGLGGVTCVVWEE